MSQITRSGTDKNSKPISTNDNRFRVLSAEAALHVVPYLEQILWDRDEEIHPIDAGMLGLSALRAALTCLVLCKFKPDQRDTGIKHAIDFLRSDDYDPCNFILEQSLIAQNSDNPFFEFEEILGGLEEISPHLVFELAGKRNALIDQPELDYGLQSPEFNLGDQTETPTPGFWSELIDKSKTPSSWSFWQEWYNSFFGLERLDWQLQRQISEIHDEEWQQGPEHIAKLIEEIRARLELEQQINQLKEENARLSEKSRFEIGANGGPELDEARQVVQEIIWEPVETLEVEAKKETPDKDVIQRQIERLKSGLKWLGSAAGGAAVGNIVNSVWENPSVLIEMVIPILETAQRWLQALINLVG